jgi:hypothetical protein
MMLYPRRWNSLFLFYFISRSITLIAWTVIILNFACYLICILPQSTLDYPCSENCPVHGLLVQLFGAFAMLGLPIKSPQAVSIYAWNRKAVGWVSVEFVIGEVYEKFVFTCVRENYIRHEIFHFFYREYSPRKYLETRGLHVKYSLIYFNENWDASFNVSETSQCQISCKIFANLF